MITLNPDQLTAENVLKDPTARFILLFGATGGGKTFIVAKNLIDRCEVAPGSRHLVLRSTSVDCRSMVFEQTFKDVINKKYHDPKYPDQSAWDFMREKGYITIEPMSIKINGSQIDFKGLDDNKLDRVLGSDYATIFISEVSLINDYKVISTLNTRLRQRVETINGKLLRMKFLMDCNPPSKRHWTYAAFAQATNPASRLPHNDPKLYRAHSISTAANTSNLSDGYMESLASDMAGNYIARKRYIEGLWYDEVENPLFSGDDIAKARLDPISNMVDDEGTSPLERADFTSVWVDVDPSMSANPGSDETGIIVMGETPSIGTEGKHCHILADLSGKYQPHEWGKIVADAFHDWKANGVIAETNQGGDLVVSNIRATNSSIPVIKIHASRGKDIRAEAASTACKQGRIHMHGTFQKLEDQLVEFEVGFNRSKKGYSPDRLDAMVHGVNHILGESAKRGVRQQRRSLS